MAISFFRKLRIKINIMPNVTATSAILKIPVLRNPKRIWKKSVTEPWAIRSIRFPIPPPMTKAKARMTQGFMLVLVNVLYNKTSKTIKGRPCKNIIFKIGERFSPKPSIAPVFSTLVKIRWLSIIGIKSASETLSRTTFLEIWSHPIFNKTSRIT